MKAQKVHGGGGGGGSKGGGWDPISGGAGSGGGGPPGDNIKLYGQAKVEGSLPKHNSSEFLGSLGSEHFNFNQLYDKGGDNVGFFAFPQAYWENSEYANSMEWTPFYFIGPNSLDSFLENEGNYSLASSYYYIDGIPDPGIERAVSGLYGSGSAGDVVGGLGGAWGRAVKNPFFWADVLDAVTSFSPGTAAPGGGNSSSRRSGGGGSGQANPPRKPDGPVIPPASSTQSSWTWGWSASSGQQIKLDFLPEKFKGSRKYTVELPSGQRIYGIPQRTGTPGHREKVIEVAEDVLNDPNLQVTAVWFDLAWSTATNGKIASRTRPDIIYQTSNDRLYHGVEVPSNTDNPYALQQRMENATRGSGAYVGKLIVTNRP